MQISSRRIGSANSYVNLHELASYAYRTIGAVLVLCGMSDASSASPEPTIETVVRTLRFKLRPESYSWLAKAAIETNFCWNFYNAVSFKAARPFAGPGKWLTGYDLCNLSSGATDYFEPIGADTIQRIATEYAAKRSHAKKVKLRWRGSSGSKRSLGWVPFKAASIRRKGKYFRFCGIDLGIKDIAATSDGGRLEAARFYRDLEAKISQAQRRGHRRQAKFLHRTAARRRLNALHQFSRRLVDQYQTIIIGDVSSLWESTQSLAPPSRASRPRAAWKVRDSAAA